MASAGLLAAGLLVRDGRLPALAFVLSFAPAAQAQGPTVIHVEGTVLHSGMKRLGINMGGQDFYDSRQMLRNLVSRNPGFEGEQWQSVLQCRTVTFASCTDIAPGTSWPEGFLDGGSYEVIAGAAKGQTGSILHSTGANAVTGSTILFTPGRRQPAADDIFVVRKSMPGNAAAGWWTSASGGATISTEFKDRSSASPGLQALRLTASLPGQTASVSSFFDSTAGHTFVRMQGRYVLSFRAKGVAGNRNLSIQLQRPSSQPVFSKTVVLSPTWQDYSFAFEAAEGAGVLGTAGLSFAVSRGSVLLDDVSVAAASSNGTVFRDEVVAALEALHPGVLRDMDSGQNFGSSLDNMLAVPGARQRAGYSKYSSEADDIAIGLHDFLVLAEKVGAEPWYTMPLGMTQAEAAHLFEYLGGSASTRYGAKRAALGHPEPWTQTFSTIHIEYGNEAWNYAQQGASIADPAAYSVRANAIFAAMRSSPWYAPGRYDLVANGQAVNVGLNQVILSSASGFDTIDVAPYLFSTFADDGSTEKIFGPMFAEPEMYDSRTNGVIYQQAKAAASARHPVNLAVYETGMNAQAGTVGQASLDAAVPSVGAGLVAIEHMLLMARDLGVTVQNTFHLGGYEAPFGNQAIAGEQSPIWGVMLDMGGATNRMRPSALAQRMANEAIRSTMLATSVTGGDPTWNQPLSRNDQVQLNGAHELQSFAFTDGTTDTLIVFNLSRTAAHTVHLEGQNAPAGAVTVETLTSAKITDSNEVSEKVKVVRRVQSGVVRGQTGFSLAPFSLTSFCSAHVR